MKNIIPSDKRQEVRMANPGKNNEFVGSRQGGPMEQSRTKSASIKHHNPEFFKRQADRKMIDGGAGSGPHHGGNAFSKGGTYGGDNPKSHTTSSGEKKEYFQMNPAEQKEYKKYISTKKR